MIGKNTVNHLMNDLNIEGAMNTKHKKYSSYKGEITPAKDNILDRDFHADNPNEKWTTDVTEFKVCDTKIYLSPLMDLYNGETICYNVSYSPNFAQIEDMMNKAFIKYPNLKGLISHSDRGWPYRMVKYQRWLEDKDIIQSMSNKGTCLDNSVMENFFGLLKKEIYYGHKFASAEDLMYEINRYISFYNNDRIKKKLNYMSPVQYRLKYAA